MSHFTLGVVNVGGGECRGGECRTIGSRGYQVPDGCVQSTTRTYTRSLTNLSRVHILPTCLMDDQSLA